MQLKIIFIFIIIISIIYLWQKRLKTLLWTESEYIDFWEEKYPQVEWNPGHHVLRDEIFVGISCFQDPELINTIESIILGSTHKLKIVVFEQIDDWGVSIEPQLQSLHSTRTEIIILKIPMVQSLGNNWSHYIIQTYWSRQQYYLQCSSSTHFPPNWDALLINKINNLPITSVISISTRDQRSPSFNSQFSFSRSHIIRDSPYDPYLPLLTQKDEELDITMRLFTRGWKFYTYPTIGIYHKPPPPDQGKQYDFIESNKLKNMQAMSMTRLYIKLGNLTGLLKYGIDHPTQIPPPIKNQIQHYSLGYWKTYKDYTNKNKNNT